MSVTFGVFLLSGSIKNCVFCFQDLSRTVNFITSFELRDVSSINILAGLEFLHWDVMQKVWWRCTDPALKIVHKIIIMFLSVYKYFPAKSA